MSNIRARFLKNKCTFWREGNYDVNNVYAKSWTIPTTISCAFKKGGAIQRDLEGADFAPMTTYYIKNFDVRIGDRIALGVSTNATPGDGAETVRKIVTKTTLTGTADMTVYTG